MWAFPAAPWQSPASWFRLSEGATSAQAKDIVRAHSSAALSPPSRAASQTTAAAPRGP